MSMLFSFISGFAFTNALHADPAWALLGATSAVAAVFSKLYENREFKG